MKKINAQKGNTCTMGVTVYGDDRIQVACWQKRADSCQIRIFKGGRKLGTYPMFSMKEDGFQDIFSVCLSGEGLTEALNGASYEFIVDGRVCQDPYAKEVEGRSRFGKKQGKVRGKFTFQNFDWKGEKWERLPMDQMVMYQCHVRGFTKHSSSGVGAPGTFQGMQEKIPYLKELGVNTLFLLPVYDFDERMGRQEKDPEKKLNYWGYGGQAFYFAPKAGYAVANPSEEFQKLVYELHKNGMNLILDMYFVDVVPEFIMQCLRYYAIHYHIDGFRVNQGCMDIGWLKKDPILSHVKLIGGSWEDQPEDRGREICFEMNDGFLVDARRFLKSDEGQTQTFYQRFKEQRNGVGQIHYITHNDGFTLRDLISYDVKHNEVNGEKNQDGTEFNYSWNCGFEGPTRRKAVLRTRKIQERNAFVMLLLGAAVPMILGGDEFGNSQRGNNNAYCLDNTTTWLDWGLLEKNRDTYEFVKRLLQFRQTYPLYHRKERWTAMDTKGLGAPDVSCHGREPWVADFSYYSRDLGILFYGKYFDSNSLYFAFNFHWDSHEFFLPHVEESNDWRICVDTAGESGQVVKERYTLAPRSIVVFEKLCSRPGQTGRKKKSKKSPKKSHPKDTKKSGSLQ